MTRPIEPPPFATDWCDKLGASPDTLEPLQGGINNQVFRCKASGRSFVLKGYPSNGTGVHDRFQAEVELLSYAREVAPDFVPQLLGFDETTRSLVLESLEGEGFHEDSKPSDDDINRAITFMRCLNEDNDLAQQNVRGSAAEGFLRVVEHLQNLEQRLSEMTVEHIAGNLRAKGEELIKCARCELDRLQESTAQMLAKGHLENALDPDARCVSPSDFGFHNAIRTLKGIKFFDFEFSGWDDPVKAVADFDLQPRIPMNRRTGALRKAFPRWEKGLSERYDALFPILKLKWALIILAVLNPIRYAQLTHRHDDRASKLMIQDKFNLAKIYITGS